VPVFDVLIEDIPHQHEGSCLEFTAVRPQKLQEVVLGGAGLGWRAAADVEVRDEEGQQNRVSR
jgi:hypothetical protein